MFKKIADNSNRESFAVQYRRKRFELFLSLLSRIQRPVHILDIGGTESYWRMMNLDLNDQVNITLMNLGLEVVELPNMNSMIGDACDIQLDDASFDIIFSNSVIEHVGNYEKQRKMAQEVRRVGKRYFVQTPNKYFPLEPHFLFPFFQFLPIGFRVWLLQRFSLGWFPRTPDEAEARTIVEAIRLLDKNEFSSLFPDATLYEEKAFGFTKSFVMYGGWDE